MLANGQITQKQTKRIGRTFCQYSFSIFSTSSTPVNTWAACLSAMLLLSTEKINDWSFFLQFSTLCIGVWQGGLLPVDEMYIGETGNCGRQNCNLGNALAGRSTGHCSAVQCIVYITALGALHCTGHCTWHSNCTVFVLNWSLGTGHFYCSALGGSAIKINWANIAAANWPTPLSIKQGCCVLDWAT